MSNAIFPNLPGLAWDVTKTPEFFTLTKTSATGLDISAVLGAYPRWNFSLAYEYLRDDGTAEGELQQLIGFFLQRYGNVDDFLYLDPDDHIATDQVIGKGDGSTTQFQLCRNYAGFVEPVYGVAGMPELKVAGFASPCTISDKALVTFNTAPAIDKLITWSGTFYYRVKFKESSAEFSKFLYKLWEAKKIEFTSVKRVLS